MLVDNQLIDKKWSNRTRQWYEDKGYIFTKTSDIFIVKAEDLSPGATDKVDVRCDYCGKVVPVKWRDYYRRYVEGGDLIYACENCRQQKTSDVYKSQRLSEQYNRAVLFCNSNNYDVITKLSDIQDHKSYIKYICPKHGIQETKMFVLNQGHKCIYCGYDAAIQSQRISVDEVEKRFNEYGGEVLNLYDYRDCMSKNMMVLCPECGDAFLTSLYAFTKHHGQRCPQCSSAKSFGEFKICQFLDVYQIPYKTQYRFCDCKDKNPLPFDVYIPNINTIIEYDGEFHYIPIQVDGNPIDVAIQRLNETKRRDKIKNQYCIDNNIRLIRIPYWDFDDINYILYNELID